jgi:hypothetical protein
MDIWGKMDRSARPSSSNSGRSMANLMVFGTMGARHLEYAQPLTAAPCYDVFPFTTLEEGGYKEFPRVNSLNRAPW